MSYYSSSVLDHHTGERIYASDVMSLEEFHASAGPSKPLPEEAVPCDGFLELRACTGFSRMGECPKCKTALKVKGWA